MELDCLEFEEIKHKAATAAMELIEKANLQSGQLVVIGCSSSEVLGETIGHGSSVEAAECIFNAIYPIFKERDIYIAAQCCEHLNRALILEKDAAEKRGYEPVNVLPQPKAGGSFATTAYKAFEHPVAVEHIKADAGLDIGLTLIGMHLKDVAVPLRLSIKEIGKAQITAARTRAKFIGGVRALYQDDLM